MTVRVALRKKRRLDNHRPEFRPTDEDKLYGSEVTLASAVEKIAHAVPESLVVDFIFDRVSAATVTRRVVDLVTDDPTLLERPLFAAFQVGEQDAAHQQRDAVNERLRRLRSNVRLRSRAEMRKALDEVLWELNVSSFDVTDPNAPARIYDRIHSQQILTDLSATTISSVDTILADSFRVSQTFSRGRTVTGLTPEQTARSIFTALSEVSPVQPTGADLASRVAVHTRGLFPGWAQAVERSGNAVAYRAARSGRDAAYVLRAGERQMERHGARLRRARARMIARTEIAAAQNAGIQSQQLAMMDAGVVSPESQKEWVTGPFDVCNICQPLGGRQVPAASSFSWQNGSGNPPAHPNCRCKTRLVPTIGQAPVRTGAGLVDNPFRYVFSDGWVAPINPVK